MTDRHYFKMPHNDRQTYFKMPHNDRQTDIKVHVCHSPEHLNVETVRTCQKCCVVHLDSVRESTNNCLFEGWEMKGIFDRFYAFKIIDKTVKYTNTHSVYIHFEMLIPD